MTNPVPFDFFRLIYGMGNGAFFHHVRYFKFQFRFNEGTKKNNKYDLRNHISKSNYRLNVQQIFWTRIYLIKKLIMSVSFS